MITHLDGPEAIDKLRKTLAAVAWPEGAVHVHEHEWGIVIVFQDSKIPLLAGVEWGVALMTELLPAPIGFVFRGTLTRHTTTVVTFPKLPPEVFSMQAVQAAVWELLTTP